MTELRYCLMGYWQNDDQRSIINHTVNGNCKVQILGKDNNGTKSE